MVRFWLQPAATLTAALLVLLSAGLTVRQRSRADAKDQWWKRTQWAIDLALDPVDPLRQEVGLIAVDEQAGSRLSDVEDAQLITAVSSNALAHAVRLRQTAGEERGGHDR